MKPICPQCRSANSALNHFCSQCGAKLTPGLDSTISFLVPQEGEDESIDLERLSLEGPLLIVIKGNSVEQTFSLGGPEVLIGRDPANDIFLDDVTVSRKHAVIKRAGGGLAVVDAGSLNGTYLNKQRVDEARLAHRDELQIGKFKMIFFDNPGVEDGS
jgi:pSer/pThr/pTyr-binding forkhead associated (FHA) protein